MSQLSLEDLACLNDQIAAMWRGGLPLDVGFRMPYGSSSAAFKRLREELAQRCEKGETIASALEQASVKTPDYFRLVVEAAQHSGNPAEALEALSLAVRREREHQEMLRQSLNYPTLIALAAYGLGVYAAWTTLPLIRGFYDDSSLTVPRFLLLARWLLDSQMGWLILGLAPLVGLAFRFWVLPGVFHRCLGGFAAHGSQGLKGLAFQATFANLLALLLKVNVPLPRALRLAAAQSGNALILRSVETAAQNLERGHSLHGDSIPGIARPIVLQIAAGAANLPERLANLADELHHRAEMRAKLVHALAPSLALFVVGGGAVLAYSASFLWPWSDLMWKIASNPGN